MLNRIFLSHFLGCIFLVAVLITSFGCSAGNLTIQNSYGTKQIVSEINAELINYYDEKDYKNNGMKCYGANNGIVLFTSKGNNEPKNKELFENINQELNWVASKVLKNNCSEIGQIDFYIIANKSVTTSYAYYSEYTELNNFCSKNTALVHIDKGTITGPVNDAIRVVVEQRTYNSLWGDDDRNENYFLDDYYK